jgi:hypothetical protein
MIIHANIWAGTESARWTINIKQEDIKTPVALFERLCQDNAIASIRDQITFISFQIDDAKGCIIPYWITRCSGKLSIKKGKFI